MIPRRKLFGNPDRTNVVLSPDGKRLAYLAPRDGVLNVFVGSVEEPTAAQPVTDDRKRGIRSFAFAATSEHLFYVQDSER